VIFEVRIAVTLKVTDPFHSSQWSGVMLPSTNFR